MRRLSIIALALIGFGVVLWMLTNEREETERKDRLAESEKQEETLFGTTEAAEAEIAEQLRERVKSDRGLLTVSVEGLVTTQPIPPNWYVSCGFDGLSLNFGPEEDANSIEITTLDLPPEKCQWLSPLLGQKVQDLFKTVATGH
jgi:hypothetical protein